MKRVEGKIIINFLLLVLSFTSLANYCVTCMQQMFIIYPCEEVAIYKAWRTSAGKSLYDMFHDIHENDASTH